MYSDINLINKSSKYVNLASLLQNVTFRFLLLFADIASNNVGFLQLIFHILKIYQHQLSDILRGDGPGSWYIK